MKKKIKKIIGAIVSIYGFLLIIGEELPGQEVLTVWEFLGLKLLGIALFSIGTYLLEGYEFQQKKNNN